MDDRSLVNVALPVEVYLSIGSVNNGVYGGILRKVV
jgi:hypothetical protein